MPLTTPWLPCWAPCWPPLLRDQAGPLPGSAGRVDRDDLAAACAGNAFYGHGLVDALAAVTTQPASGGPDSAAVVRGYRTQR